jgi:hypothetical protein
MNRKQFTFLLALVVVIGAISWVVHQRSQSSWQSHDSVLGQKLLGTNFAFNEVAHLTFKEATNELNLVKKDGIWRVRERNDYPANYSDIRDFLLKVSDAKVVQLDQVGPSQLSRYSLAPGQGTNAALVVEFKDQADKPLKSLLLGKKHLRKSNRPSQSPMGDMEDPGFPDGRYVKTAADSGTVALISEPFANIEPKPEQWLDKEFLKIDKVRSLAVTYPVATNSWKLTRDTETAEWKLAEAKPTEQLDATKASGLANSLVSPTFSDVDVSSKPEQLGLDKPMLVTLDTFDNFAYTLKIGQKTNENYPVMLSVSAQLPKERTPGKDEKPEDKTRLDKEFKDNQKKLQDKLAQEQAYGKWTYLVSAWTFEPMLKERGQLLVEKKEEPKKEETPAVPPTGGAPKPAEPVAAPAATNTPAAPK